MLNIRKACSSFSVNGLLEVLGSAKVTITKAGQQQYSLSSGNHFDLRRRKPL